MTSRDKSAVAFIAGILACLMGWATGAIGILPGDEAMALGILCGVGMFAQCRVFLALAR